MRLIIPYVKSSQKDEAYYIVKETILNNDYLEQLSIKTDIEFNDESYELITIGKGFRLKVDFREKDLEVHMELSFFLRPFSVKIEKEIISKISKVV